MENVSLTVAPGERVALFGPAGAGKTTLLRALRGDLTAESGEARVLGRPPREARRHAGWAPQRPDFALRVTPQQAVWRALARRRLSAARRTARATELLESFGLYAARERTARELSTGEQKALAICAAVAAQPQALLLDDALAGLSAPLADIIDRQIRALQESAGCAVLMATTDSRMAESANRTAILDAGRLLIVAPPRKLLAAHAPVGLTVTPADPATVRKTLRGIFDVEVTEDGRGVHFATAAGESAAATLFRHPPGAASEPPGAQVVYLRQPTLWDALNALRHRSRE